MFLYLAMTLLVAHLSGYAFDALPSSDFLVKETQLATIERADCNDQRFLINLKRHHGGLGLETITVQLASKGCRDIYSGPSCVISGLQWGCSAACLQKAISSIEHPTLTYEIKPKGKRRTLASISPFDLVSRDIPYQAWPIKLTVKKKQLTQK